ncbi:MAG TPA: HAMP domain-containing sensor histidine kinase [Thermoanaerobaculia bacterium]
MLQADEPDVTISLPLKTKTARYALAVIAVGVAFAIDMVFSRAMAEHRYAPFLLAIILVSFFTDRSTALTSTLLAIVATNYADYLLEHTLRIDSADVVQTAIFITTAMSISILTARLAKANAELRELDRSKDRFIAAISHELRTPVTVIMGWAGILRETDGEEFRQTAAAAIEQSARAQARLIEDLLDMTRLLLGKMHLQLEPVKLDLVVRQAAEMIRPAAEAKSISLSVSVPEHACVVRGDSVRLQQICWNLLQNAVKFTPASGRVSIELACRDRVAEICVADSGPGIARDLLPRIFEPFRQGDGAEEQGGLGLGLAIVRELVSAHHGTIEAQSEGEGKGARFAVRLPRE